MTNESILGIDLGATLIRGGLISDHKLSEILTARIDADAGAEQVLGQVMDFVDSFMDDSVKAIGIGVPGIVDTENGIVYDVINIPSWRKIRLRELMEDRFDLPIVINNDANCFALGEFHFGKGKGCDCMIGLTIGTGLGSGIILNKKLYSGKNGGAGEFGMIGYLDKYYEYYASGSFFKNVYQMDGEVVFKLAREGNPHAIKMYEELGIHLGNAIKTILYSFDIDLIVLGGSVRQAFPYFSRPMWKEIETFAFQRAVKQLKIEVSELDNSGIMGAAALYYDLKGF